MCNHAANVVPDNMDTLADSEMSVNEVGQVCSHDRLGEGAVRARRLSSTPIVWGDHAIAGARQRNQDMAKLVASLGKAVDQEDDAPFR